MPLIPKKGGVIMETSVCFLFLLALAHICVVIVNIDRKLVWIKLNTILMKVIGWFY